MLSTVSLRAGCARDKSFPGDDQITKGLIVHSWWGDRIGLGVYKRRLDSVLAEDGSVAAVAGSHRMAEVFRRHNPNVSVIWTGTYATQPATAVSNE